MIKHNVTLITLLFVVLGVERREFASLRGDVPCWRIVLTIVCGTVTAV